MDILTVFKVRLARSTQFKQLNRLAQVEDQLFRINRALLDNEEAMVPGGVGSENDPIELTYIKATDFEILLDFLILGCA